MTTMQADNNVTENLNSKSFMEGMVRFGLIIFLTMLCLRIFSPFAGIVIWGLVLAVMLYPLHQRLAKKMGGRQGYAATVIVLIGFILIGVPLMKLGNSTITEIQELKTAVENNTLQVIPANPVVAEWPVVGEKLYQAWNEAVSNLTAFMEKYQPQLREFSIKAFSKMASIFLSVLAFLAALAVAGFMMAWGKSGSMAMQRIISRVVGPEKGLRIQRLSIATTRSVATGVLGVAFIQALLFGIGFMLTSIPAAALLALLVMLLGIMQLPALLVALPVIAYLWSSGD
jgi:predicted PurR-regulated permease PerM